MAEVPVQFRGTLYDLANKRAMQVFLDGVTWRSDVGIGGGPVIPPGDPPGIWGGPIDPYPDHGLPGKPPGIWGPNDPRPNPPIAFPPGWVGGVPPLPPNVTPPEPPPPGSPTTKVPGNWPVTGIVPPDYMIVQYPGIGPVVVSPPAQADQQKK